MATSAPTAAPTAISAPTASWTEGKVVQTPTGPLNVGGGKLVQGASPTVVTDANTRESTIPGIVAKTNTYTNPIGSGSGQFTLGKNGEWVPNADNTNNSASTGSTSTDTSNQSYADILKGVTDGLNGQPEDPIIAQERTLIDNMMKNSDAVTASSIAAIQQQYESKYASTVEQQKGTTAGIEQSLNLGGSSRYAPISSQGILSSKDRYDMQTLSDLQATENTQIATLKQAQVANDYKAMSDQLALLDKTRTEKQTLAQKIADNMVATNQQNKKDVNSIMAEAAKNGAPKDVLDAIGKSGNENTAISASGEWLQSASGTLGDYLQYKRDATSKGLVPKDYETYKNEDLAKTEKIKADAKNQSDSNFTASDKTQQKLEQQYRGILSKEFSSRTGALGVENAKVNQANHLNSLFQQYYNPKTKEYNIPTSQYHELAMGLASMVAGANGTTQSQVDNITAATAKGDLNAAIQWATGVPQNGSTQDIIKNLIDSVDRQAETAVRNREAALQNMRDQAPTDLEQSRIDKLNKSTQMVGYEGQDRISKGNVNNYIIAHPNEAESIAKLYEVPGATDKDIEAYLRAQGKIQ